MKGLQHTITVFLVLAGLNCKAQGAPDLSGPGPELKQLSNYIGDWNVQLQMGDQTYSGTSNTQLIVGDRFLQVDFEVKNSSSKIEGIFIIGFDRRNEVYQVLGMDSFGSYFVTAAGPSSGDYTAKAYGKDDDPMMKKMGFEKEFGYNLTFKEEKKFIIEIFWIDNRTAVRTEIKALEYIFNR